MEPDSYLGMMAWTQEFIEGTRKGKWGIRSQKFDRTYASIFVFYVTWKTPKRTVSWKKKVTRLLSRKCSEIALRLKKTSVTKVALKGKIKDHTEISTTPTTDPVGRSYMIQSCAGAWKISGTPVNAANVNAENQIWRQKLEVIFIL